MLESGDYEAKSQYWPLVFQYHHDPSSQLTEGLYGRSGLVSVGSYRRPTTYTWTGIMMVVRNGDLALRIELYDERLTAKKVKRL